MVHWMFCLALQELPKGKWFGTNCTKCCMPAGVIAFIMLSIHRTVYWAEILCGQKILLLVNTVQENNKRKLVAWCQKLVHSIE